MTDEIFTDKYKATMKNRRPINGEWYPLWLSKLAEMLNNGYSPSIIVQGDTGRGKSMKTLRACEIMYDDMNLFKGSFDPVDNLCYDPLHFIDKMTRIPTPDPDQRINPDREAIIIDEAGVNLNVSEYHSDMNKSVDEVLQTMRIKNCVYFFIAPTKESMDTRVRQDADMIITVKEPGYAIVWGSDYKHTSSEKHKGYQRPLPLTFWRPDMPSKKLREKYQGKEYEFKDENLEELKNELVKKRKEEKKQEATKKIDDLLSDI